jgi:hypothetical protein
MDSIVRARLRLSRDKLSSPERDASFGQALRGNTAFGMPSSRILAFSNRKKKNPRALSLSLQRRFLRRRPQRIQTGTTAEGVVKRLAEMAQA